MKNTKNTRGKTQRAAFCAAMLTLTASLLTSCQNGDDDGKYKVAIGQFGEHASLDNCTNGFIEGLKRCGYTEGDNLVIDIKNASFDTGNCASIAKSFVSEKPDLVCAVATPIAQIFSNAVYETDIPLVYSAVTDPVSAMLTDGETTGTSDMLPVESQLAMIREILPEAKKIGILFTNGEANSKFTLDMYKALAPEYGFEITEKAVNDASEVSLAAKAIINEVDCISNMTDNTVVGQLDMILDIASENGKPVFGSEIEQVKKGCAAGCGIDYFELGIKTGEIAARILSGEKMASEIPFETITEPHIYINTESAKELGIEFPETINNAAQDVCKTEN